MAEQKLSVANQKTPSPSPSQQRPAHPNTLPRQATLTELLTAFSVLALAIVGFGLVNGGFSARKKELNGLRFFTEHELSRHDGSRSDKSPHVAVLGAVFDVSHGYTDEPRCLGLDCSAVFATGIWQANPSTLTTLDKHEREHLIQRLRDYELRFKKVGYVQGNFYDRYGRPTAALTSVMTSLEDHQHHS